MYDFSAKLSDLSKVACFEVIPVTDFIHMSLFFLNLYAKKTHLENLFLSSNSNPLRIPTKYLSNYAYLNEL